MNTKLLNYLEDYKFYNISVVNDDTLSGINAVIKKIYVINLLEDVRKRNYIHILLKFSQYTIRKNKHLVKLDLLE